MFNLYKEETTPLPNTPFTSTLKYNILSYNNINNFVLEINLCGYEKEDIKIFKEEGFLIVEASEPSELNTVEENFIIKKFILEPVRGKFKISDDLKIENTSYQNGVLRINFVKIPVEKEYIQIN